MRIAVVGDTHARIEKIRNELKTIKPDLMLFTGDFYSDAVRLSRHLNLNFKAVAGNCDAANAGPHELLIEISGRRFYMIHGHQYGVKRGLQSLFYRGKEKEADVVLFGHTHVPFCEKIDGIWLINPGSPSRPRLTPEGSYVLIDIQEDGLNPRLMKI